MLSTATRMPCPWSSRAISKRSLLLTVTVALTVCGLPLDEPDRPGVGGGGEDEGPEELSVVEAGEALRLTPDKDSELPNAGHPRCGLCASAWQR